MSPATTLRGVEDRPLFVGTDGLTYCDRHIENHEA